MSLLSSASLKSRLLAPLTQALERASSTRTCHAISDHDWLLAGVRRCLESYTSGRDLLQRIGLFSRGYSTYFESLKSQRRLALVSEINQLTADLLHSPESALLDQHLPGLSSYEVFAGDGHWHRHAAHDKIHPDSGKKYATGHLYGLNLRSGQLSHLITADGVQKKKEHDLSALKRLGPQPMRMGAPKGRKVIWIWDKAGIDFTLWHHWKQQHGLYFISLEKENMKLQPQGEIPLNREVAINEGVERDELVGTFAGTTVRRITHRDPARGEKRCFITTLTDQRIPPGAIAQLYRMRWDIEKVFDDVKNKFGEQKAWATTETAKTIQAELICLTWNLVRSFEIQLSKQEGVKNEAENRRRGEQATRADQDLRDRGRIEGEITMATRLIRSTQISVKFIRWIRYTVWSESADRGAIAELRSLYAKL